ncbi:putative WRKY transcription factor 70 [Platanthera zijinensis]|uniref:WRKY transcription factor 70 n=1 Tax=Platanthera zijinensis TaxID=2320716 RepID=A0AAP0B527_9ASPA
MEISSRLSALLRLSPPGGCGAAQSCTVSNILESDEHMDAAAVSGPACSGAVVQRRPLSGGKADVFLHPKRRNRSHSLTTTSCAPYDDGFQWRKYGEKKISKTKFTRSYFRCTYRDEQGCMATKQVQRKEMEDPPMFLVTYSYEHTCSYLISLFLTEETPIEDLQCSMNNCQMSHDDQTQQSSLADMFNMTYSTLELVEDDQFIAW